MTDLTALKQACLDLSKAGTDLFDAFDEHGFEAAWEGDNVFIIVRLQDSFEVLRSFFSQQATSRMLALGISPEQLAQMNHPKRR